MNDTDSDDLIFDTYYRVGTSNETIRFHIAQCVSGDIDRDTCVKLAYNSCNVACLAIDIVRGRLGVNMLNALVHPTVIGYLENLIELLDLQPSTFVIPWADGTRKHHLLILRTLNGFVISPTHFTANIGLTVGGQPCWAYVVFRSNGRKWMCMHCDFW
ncbi:hypothetical protein [Alloscardovia macacae]|uniref:Protoporphyrinogen oxidase n=1 Tax=Alloscardovia macacae TaxID=1160091 RepID=A0A261F5J4_9BIFI|nr:hypothetical protein [Alloscardovia macacae]OZG54374.1 protoporphyrinogen oxidase [Alloscardovia macacae]